MTPEGEVKKTVSKLLKSYPNVFYDMPVPSGYGKSTIDYFGCAGGLFFAIEAKAEGKEPTARQWRILETIVDAGGKIFAIDGPGIQMNRLIAFLEDAALIETAPEEHDI